jgi:hypothetical protein
MPADLSIRHIIATLAYRAAKVLRDAPDGFGEFRAAPGSRAAGEILAHICDVLDWALSQARGEEHWSNSNPASWAEDSERFFAATTALDQYLAAHESHVPLEKLFQSAIADSFTHVGQIALLRRLAGAPIKGENYFKAQIEQGRVGSDQNAPAREFD